MNLNEDPFAEFRVKESNNSQNSFNPRTNQAVQNAISPQQPSSQLNDPFAEFRPGNAEPKNPLGFWESVSQGKQKSVYGRYQAIKTGDIKKQFEKDLPFWKSLAETATETLFDIPVMAAGSLIGGSAGTAISPGTGTAIGAGAGGFALPTLLKTAMNEYIDFQNQGNDLTFGEFIERSAKVSKETGKAGLLGGFMGVFQKALPFIKKVPGLDKLFDTKYIGKPAELAAKGLAETSALTAGQATLEGELPSKEDFAKNAILLTGMKAAHQGAETIKNPSRLIPESKVAKIERLKQSFEEIPTGGPPPPPPPPPGGIPLHGYETQKSALSKLIDFENQEIQGKAAERNKPIGQPPIGGEKPLAGRNVKVGGEPFDLVFKATPKQELTPHAELLEQVGDVITPVEYKNKTVAAKVGKNVITKTNEEVYRGVNELYEDSKNAMEGIDTIYIDLADRIISKIDKLEKIPQGVRSSPENQLLAALEGELDKIAEVKVNKDETGRIVSRDITGYKSHSAQSLIDDIQSLRHKVDNDFAHGDPKNIVRPFLEDLHDAVEGAARHSKTPEALQKWQNARSGYRVWSQTFNNKDIRPWKSASNENYISLFDNGLNIDKFNIINKVLRLSPEGEALANANRREIVEKTLSKFTDNPRKSNPREVKKALQELEEIITPEQADEIGKLIEQKRKGPPFEAKKQKVSKTEERVSKFFKMKPENIGEMTNEISGIRELRKLEKTPEGKQDFDILMKQRTRSILTEGEIGKNSTGKDYEKVLSKEHNNEILSEIYGEEVAQDALQIAREIGNRELTTENVKKYAKKSKTIGYFLALKSALASVGAG